MGVSVVVFKKGNKLFKVRANTKIGKQLLQRANGKRVKITYRGIDVTTKLKEVELLYQYEVFDTIKKQRLRKALSKVPSVTAFLLDAKTKKLTKKDKQILEFYGYPEEKEV